MLLNDRAHRTHRLSLHLGASGLARNVGRAIGGGGSAAADAGAASLLPFAAGAGALVATPLEFTLGYELHDCVEPRPVADAFVCSGTAAAMGAEAAVAMPAVAAAACAAWCEREIMVAEPLGASNVGGGADDDDEPVRAPAAVGGGRRRALAVATAAAAAAAAEAVQRHALREKKSAASCGLKK